MTRISPVIKLASSLPRNSIDFATSDGELSKFIRGTSWAASERKLRFYCSVYFWLSFFVRAAVNVTPGATAFTLTPWKEVSRAEVLTNILSIAIEVEKIIEPG